MTYWPHSNPETTAEEAAPTPAVSNRRDRDELLNRLTEDVRELTGIVVTSARRPGYKDDTGQWIPSKPNPTRLPSLLVQLELLRAAAATPGTGHRSDPGSRTPPGSAAADLLADIDAGVRRLIDKVQEDLDHIRRPARRRYRRGRLDMLGYDSGLGYYPSASPSTERPIRGLSTANLIRLAAEIARNSDMKTTERICKDVHSWANQARLALRYLAPMVTLEAPCTYCMSTKVDRDGRHVGDSLITRADASIDVICVTEGCVDENGETPRWPRLTWPMLLDGGAG